MSFVGLLPNVSVPKRPFFLFAYFRLGSELAGSMGSNRPRAVIVCSTPKQTLP